MEKVVYVLGAGFSAPLGLPVMADFLTKAKDMFAEDPKKYEHFEKVFKMLQRLHYAKGFFETDLLNIEEVLSILEMENYLDGSRSRRQFTQFIGDVIIHHTPDYGGPSQWDGSRDIDYLALLGDNKWQGYFAFVASLCNLTVWAYIELQRRRTGSCSVEDNRAFDYSLITLNYDLVVENVFERIKWFQHEAELKTELDKKESLNPEHLYLAKLHGTVESQEPGKSPIIVLPTWSKGSNEKVRPAWRLAFNLLRDANYIRVLGYSLPESDAYVRYLFKSAILVTCSPQTDPSLVRVFDDHLIEGDFHEEVYA